MPTVPSCELSGKLVSVPEPRFLPLQIGGNSILAFNLWHAWRRPWPTRGALFRASCGGAMVEGGVGKWLLTERVLSMHWKIFCPSLALQETGCGR